MMELSEFYPSPPDLIDNELKVLDYLSSDPYIAQKQSKFLHDAESYRKQYRRPRPGFQFASSFDVYSAEMPKLRKREPNLKLLLAATIGQEDDGTYGNISYALAVCRIRSLPSQSAQPAKHPSIWRKFHFDITAGTDRNRRQEHPMSHLQYCGGMVPLWGEHGLRQAQLQQLHMKLSEPRIFFWPMSLALLIDMALHEFPDVKSAMFRGSPEWRGIIRENEKLLLRPFYEKCVEVIVDSASKNRILADEFYS